VSLHQFIALKIENLTSKYQVRQLNSLRDNLSTIFESMVLADVQMKSETNNLTESLHQSIIPVSLKAFHKIP